MNPIVILKDYAAGGRSPNLHPADKPGGPIAPLMGVMDKSVGRLFSDPGIAGYGKSDPAHYHVPGGLGTGDRAVGQLTAVDTLSL